MKAGALYKTPLPGGGHAESWPGRAMGRGCAPVWFLVAFCFEWLRLWEIWGFAKLGVPYWGSLL